MLVTCQECSGFLSDAAASCPKCGAVPDAYLGARHRCSECGSEYRLAYSACRNCGAPREVALANGSTELVSEFEAMKAAPSVSDQSHPRAAHCGDDVKAKSSNLTLGPFSTAESAARIELSLWGYFIKCMRLSFSGEGRARRKEYWGFHLFFVMPSFAVGLLSGLIFGDAGPALILGLLWGLVCLPAALSVTIRRLHDLGTSGWWVLLFFVPYLGLLFLIVCGLLPSEQRSNKHGLCPVLEHVGT
jgi:uncharacterized membrane protein YhaH (DUF805 family)